MFRSYGRICKQCNAAMLLTLYATIVLGATVALQVQGGWLCTSGALLNYLWKNCDGNRKVNVVSGDDRSSSMTVGSPCPSVFRYEWDGVEWYGVITAPSVSYGTRAHLVARLSIGRALPTKYPGALELLNTRAEALHALLTEQPILYKVKFPIPYPVPIVATITLNERIICSGSVVNTPIVTSIVLEHTLYPHGQPLNSEIPQPNSRFGKDRNSGNNVSQQTPSVDVPSLPNTRNLFSTHSVSQTDNQQIQKPSRVSTMNIIEQGLYNEVCGNPVSVRPLVANGEAAKRGSYPWLTALFTQNALGLEFTCGGTLVSARYVITAAHCIRYGENRSLTPDELLVVLGRYHIQGWTEKGSVVRDVKNIILHQDYGALSGDADLAAVELSDPVTFTDTIRPACSWSLNSNIPNAVLVGREGIIVGWGRDGTGQRVTPEPRQTRVRIVSQEECLRSRLEFRYITSNRTFCASGITPKSGPCSGDSGGGLYVKENGRWFLSGVISMSLVDPDTKSCDLNSFSVFVDMSKFYEWLTPFLR